MRKSVRKTSVLENEISDIRCCGRRDREYPEKERESWAAKEERAQGVK